MDITTAGVGKSRKNKNLTPINSYFDLYSKGKDGLSTLPLTAKASRDDVILANDGAFIGLASNYD
jgi:general secretion pathway protein G